MRADDAEDGEAPSARGEPAGAPGPAAGAPLDRGALDRRFEEAAPALYAWARLRIPASLAPLLEPEDLLQEVWLRASRGVDRYDPAQGPLRAWLVGIAKHVLLEALRRARSARPLTGGSETRLFALQSRADTVTSITRRVERAEDVQRFLAAVAALADTDRDVLVHRGLEELTAAETATRLGLSVEAVHKRWQRLRADLRERGLGRDLVGEA